ncbi:MAG: L-threonylcarbamoyladenylate synthase [Synechococcaceae cyanobacterium]|nr:L-threonylcarbamoyladenylate synthase [Synechococcaceae cyanobacterium]
MRHPDRAVTPPPPPPAPASRQDRPVIPAAARVLSAEALAAHLEQGGAALFPTDTVPALAARPERAGQLWSLKHRPQRKPLILMGADLHQLVDALGGSWAGPWLEQAGRCWPGAFTLVLPITGALPAALHPAGTGLGLRVPDCPMARDLLRRSGPLATTSANLSGEPPALTAGEAAERFPGLPLLGPLPWPGGSGTASTVISWEPGDSWRILRRGTGLPPPGDAAG